MKTIREFSLAVFSGAGEEKLYLYFLCTMKANRPIMDLKLLHFISFSNFFGLVKFSKTQAAHEKTKFRNCFTSITWRFVASRETDVDGYKKFTQVFKDEKKKVDTKKKLISFESSTKER